MSDIGETQTMVRTHVGVDDSSFLLAQGQDVTGLKREIEGAAHAGGGFVDFVVVGNRTMSVLITPVTRVVFSIETVEYDARDDGDDSSPYGGTFDLL
jgi:hypothetical protein